MTKESAVKAIAVRLDQIDTLIKECEGIALKNKVDFAYDLPYGSYLQFDGSSEEQLGWNQSQC